MNKKAKALGQARVRANNNRNVGGPLKPDTIPDERDVTARHLTGRKRRVSHADVLKAVSKRN